MRGTEKRVCEFSNDKHSRNSSSALLLGASVPLRPITWNWALWAHNDLTTKGPPWFCTHRGSELGAEIMGTLDGLAEPFLCLDTSLWWTTQALNSAAQTGSGLQPQPEGVGAWSDYPLSWGSSQFIRWIATLSGNCFNSPLFFLCLIFKIIYLKIVVVNYT